MGKANSRPNGGSGITFNQTNYSPEPITPAEATRQAKIMLRLYGTEAALQ